MHALMRYASVGGLIFAVYAGLTLLLSEPVGLPVQGAIPIAYVSAVSLHFLLQRVFVFAHVADFELSTRDQVHRYVVIGGVQYALTAASTALLPSLLGVGGSGGLRDHRRRDQRRELPGPSRGRLSRPRRGGFVSFAPARPSRLTQT